MVTADLTTFTQIAAGVAEIVVPLLAAWVSKEIISNLHISSTAAAAGHVQQGVEALSELAVDAMRTAASSNTTISINDAVDTALNAVSKQLVIASKVAGTTPQDLAARVTSAVISKLTLLNMLPTTTTAAKG